VTEESDNTLSNEHIFEYLKYYCDRENSFDFGVMIKGPWGVGKTFLIKSFLASLKDKKFITGIYISLYGKTLPSQIDDDIFQQLHPVLGSKGVKILGLVAKGLIKSATKIDLGKIETVTFDAELPSVNLKDMFPSPKDCLIVFDDLERCSIPVVDILGYINSFVEHENVKVIVIANEKEIENRAEFERYKTIKEKLIGKTLEVRSVESLAVRNFVDSVSNKRTRDFLKVEINQILDIHKRSGSDNLRILRQGIWDFERLAVCFSESHWKSIEAMRLVLRVILALSYEIKLGRVSQDELPELRGNSIARAMRRQSKAAPPTRVDEVQDRYPDVEFEQTVISPTTIANLLFRGWIDRFVLARDMEASSYFADPSQEPAWKTALGVWRHNDDVVEQACIVLEQKFRSREFIEPSEMFMIFGVRLFLSEAGLVEEDKATIQAECIEYINDLRDEGKIRNKYKEEAFFGSFGGWGGYAFPCGETEEFRLIKTHYAGVVDEVAREGIPKSALELLDLMKEDSIKFGRMIFVNAFEDSPYWDVPVLSYVPVDKFVSTLLQLSPESQSSTIVALKLRYERGGVEHQLKEELSWLEKLFTALRSKSETLRPTSRFRINSRLDQYIVPYLRDLPSARSLKPADEGSQ